MSHKHSSEQTTTWTQQPLEENAVPKLQLNFGGYSDAGVKESNDDAFTALLPTEHNARKYKGSAACIADGASCSANAQFASQTAVTNFMADYFSTPDFWTVKQSTSKVISSINSWLFQQGQKRLSRSDGFVTTFSALIIKSHTAHILHVGDSRIYLIRDQQIELLTQDHCYQGGGNSYLTRALGIENSLNLDYRLLKVKLGDRFILTTDGIHEVLDEQQLLTLAKPKAQSGSQDFLESIATTIGKHALKAGSDDNISCLIVDVASLPVERVEEAHRNLSTLKIPPSMQVNNKIDHFEIIRILHNGTRSHVYLVKDIHTDEQRVLKMPSVNFEDDMIYLEAFVREQWIGRKLSHPQIMKMYPPTQDSQFLYHVCEYIEGQTLRQWMLDNPNPGLDKIRELLDGMIGPVRALHRDKMIHRDLKPDNYIINHDGVITLVDFGTMQIAGIQEIKSKQMDDDNPVGDIDYIAPESLIFGSSSPSSDLFSIAAIIYEMITGQQPFTAIQSNRHIPKGFDKWQYKPLNQLLNPPKDIPEWVNTVLKKALSPNPDYRYQAMSELRTDLYRPSVDILKSAEFIPYMERNPLRFWKTLSGILLAIIIIQWALNY